MNRMIWIGFVLLGIMACTTPTQEELVNPMDRLPDNKGGEIVRKAIAYAGGWEAWESKKNFSFYKKITSLDSLGTVTRRLRQLHKYSMEPHFMASMSWQKDDSNFEIINTGEKANKYENDIWLEDDKSKKEAWNSSFGSNYVIQMPFKLTDPGTIINYDKIDSTTFDRPVHAVSVDYESWAGSSGGMHKWCYYFDAETFDLVANYMDYGNGQSMTLYKTFEDIDGIRIHKLRHSHASNKHRDILQLKTIYENEEMAFVEQFDGSLFELK